MKFLIKLLLFLLAVAFCAFVWARATTAQAPQSNSSIISPPYGPVQAAISPSLSTPLPSNRTNKQTFAIQREQSGRHSTRAERTISPEKLTDWLTAHSSPLASYSAQILVSPYWSTIIGICTIEQYGCTRAPENNYWGIMLRGGGLRKFSSLPEGITAISDLLASYEEKGYDTIEELNGYYVVPASNNWLNTVIKTKQELESL